jgi:hypothetical protein
VEARQRLFARHIAGCENAASYGAKRRQLSTSSQKEERLPVGRRDGLLSL